MSVNSYLILKSDILNQYDCKFHITHPDTLFAFLSIKRLTLFLKFFSFLPTHLNSSVYLELPWTR